MSVTCAALRLLPRSQGFRQPRDSLTPVEEGQVPQDGRSLPARPAGSTPRLSGTGEGSEVRCEERALFTQSPVAFPHFAGSFCSICNDLSSASIPTLGRVLPSIRSLIALCEKQRVAAAADPRNADAEHILLAARDEYTAYFAEWTSNDLLLAATLIDPSQATDYFLSHPGGAVSAVAALAQAWAALDKLAQDLTPPPPPAGGGAAPGGAAVGIAAVSLAELLAGVQGGGAAAGAHQAASLADEKASFLSFMSENHAMLKGDQLPALAFYKKYKNRIPKIAVV